MIEQKIASLAREYNRLNNEYARIVMRRIRNVWLSEDGEVTTIEPPEYLEAKEDELKAEINETLYEIEQAIGVRDVEQKRTPAM